MPKVIDYYFAPMSPWSYLGHDRLAGIARNHGAQINVKPVDFGKIFPASGGLPLAKRAPQRQKYRLVELARWKNYLGLPLTIQPKYFPYDANAASLLIIAVSTQLGNEAAMNIASAIFRGCWVEERNMGDPDELLSIIKAQGHDAAALTDAARSGDAAARYQALTDEAMQRDVFGAPTYVYNDELFWGQDRLDFLDRALA
jgi:2-hydroxychromene-2-carboxylate isomerase